MGVSSHRGPSPGTLGRGFGRPVSGSGIVGAICAAAGILLAPVLLAPVLLTPLSATAQTAGVPPIAVSTSPPLDALTLGAALDRIAARNRDVQSARRALEASRANVLAAGARPNPNLSFGAGAINPKAGIGAGNLRDKTVDTFVRIDQVIERGNKRELRIDNARALENAAGADLSDAVRQQRLAVAAAYYDLLEAQERVAVTAENVDLFARTIAAGEQRLKAGDIAAADLTRIRVDSLRAQNDARLAEADRVRAQVGLAFLIAAEGDAARLRAIDPWPIPALPAVPGAEPDPDLAAAVEKRPDVRSAQLRIEAAAQARELARRLRTRDVSVGAQYDHYPSSATNTLGSGNSFGVSMMVPLFWRYGYEGEIRRAEVDYFAAQDQLERVRASALTELARARGDLRAAAERLVRYDASLLVEARRSAEYAEFAYRNGAIGVMDLLDARRVLRATQLDAAQARSDHAKALAAWQAALMPIDAIRTE